MTRPLLPIVTRPGDAPVGCAVGCGLCCDPVILTYHLEQLTMWSTASVASMRHADPETDDGWQKWRDTGWTDDQRPGVVLRMSDLYDRRNAVFAAEHWVVLEGPQPEGQQGVMRVACDAFDRHTRSCTVHASGGQPPICQQFPHYQRDPGDPEIDAYATMTSCSYVADIKVMLTVLNDDAPPPEPGTAAPSQRRTPGTASTPLSGAGGCSPA